jgi:hypothetical protein
MKRTKPSRAERPKLTKRYYELVDFIVKITESLNCHHVHIDKNGKHTDMNIKYRLKLDEATLERQMIYNKLIM